MMMKIVILLLLIQLISISSLKISSSKSLLNLRKSSVILKSSTNGEFSNAERIESVKVGIISSFGGSLFALPLLLIKGIVSNFDAQWELSTDLLALTLALYGLTYRYAVRKDSNPNLKQGATISFVLTRILPLVKVPSYCSSLPLDCGPPLHYGTVSMITDISFELVLSLVAFFGANYVIEYFFKKNLLSTFPKS
jgi:hypothetical protein